MTVVEADFWDRHVCPTVHALERFAQRAQPPALDWPYLKWALRDLAVGEGWLSYSPPPWTRLEHRATFYVVIGQFLCLPMYPHRRCRGVWQPTTTVNPDESLTWDCALAYGYVRLPPPPPRPPGPAPFELSDQSRRDLERQASRRQIAARRTRPALPGVGRRAGGRARRRSPA